MSWVRRRAWPAAPGGLQLDGRCIRAPEAPRAGSLMPRRGVTKAPAWPATLRMPGVDYTRHSQTLCVVCQRRAQWNGDRWIHLTVFARGIHDARPDLGLVIDSSDPRDAQKLALMEAGVD